LLYFRDDCVGSFLADVVHHNIRTELAVHMGIGTSEPGASASDNHGLAVEANLWRPLRVGWKFRSQFEFALHRKRGQVRGHLEMFQRNSHLRVNICERFRANTKPIQLVIIQAKGEKRTNKGL